MYWVLGIVLAIFFFSAYCLAVLLFKKFEKEIGKL
jgi:hypothetical protein